MCASLTTKRLTAFKSEINLLWNDYACAAKSNWSERVQVWSRGASRANTRATTIYWALETNELEWTGHAKINWWVRSPRGLGDERKRKKMFMMMVASSSPWAIDRAFLNRSIRFVRRTKGTVCEKDRTLNANMNFMLRSRSHGLLNTRVSGMAVLKLMINSRYFW